MAVLDIATALAQSRHQILTSLLPLFSSPSRPSPRQPNHSGKLIANTTLTIGPHSFLKTKLFLITFDPNPDPDPDPDSPTLSPQSSPPPPPAPAPRPFSGWLIERLNELAAGDDKLQAVLQRAAVNEAGQEEVAELTRVIDKIKKEERDKFGDERPLPSTSRAHGTRGSAQRERTPEPESVIRVPPYPAVLIEFAEAPRERYLLPSHFAFTAIPDGSQSPSDVQAVRLECFVRPGQAGTSVLDDQRPPGKGKAREVEGEDGGELVPVMIEVAGCNENARAALFGASRTSRKGDRSGDSIWDDLLAAAAPPASATQPVLLHRLSSPSPEPEEPRWRLSSYAKIEWVYDDDLATEQAKKKPPKRVAAPAAGGVAKKQKLGQLKGGSAPGTGTGTPASSQRGADTPEPAGLPSSAREESGTPAAGAGGEGQTPPVKKKKNNKTTGQYAGMGRGWRAAAAAAMAEAKGKAKAAEGVA